MVRRRQIKQFSLFAVLTVSAFGLSGCKTISQDSCLTGNWEAIGFKDGANGKSTKRLSKIAESCSEYGVSVDNQAYWSGYDLGLTKYCTFERGFARGESGGSYNQVCSGDLAEYYAPGYQEGRIIYDIHREHDRLVDRYYDKYSALDHVRDRLRQEEMSDKERRRLKDKARRLENDLDRIRYNIRSFERQHNLPRFRLDRSY